MMHPWQTHLARQLKELHLIQCSLLPGEHFAFVLPSEDFAIWTSLLDTFTNAAFADDGDTDQEGLLASLPHPPCQAHFEIRVTGLQVWFEAAFPRCTDLASGACANAATSITVSVKGEDVSREAHEHWHAEIRTRTIEIDETSAAFPAYELLTLLTASLHSSQLPSSPVTTAPSAPAPASASTSTPAAATATAPSPSPPYHALLTSHHLVSTTKRRTMQQLSSQLGITGFAKVGYPGIIYAEGPREAVEGFVRDVRSMQWLALRVRFVEPVEGVFPDEGQHVRWAEVSKIGEVLELMRARGREALVTRLGIGVPSRETKRSTGT